ncbi:cytochrome c biogenesis protein ResB [Cytobacillus purgationiresistens]|uniref:Cytochrome c biogenesis protein n=1 Tax=Cytobacillus purgationiresistens TaxID=863449 RepID=A0ABU0AL66_9BACI|nr:cytochrome c biogenesis protein ResB [Cytobacillus purgationiresistens]MDQ0271128.1 cytochrome c biogenesis protein [Cytobacillus purgationiresistens]
MKQVKCECGHVNPHGTVLCESCGRVLVEEEKSKKVVDMRYEGSARRSQTYNKTIIDKIWNFFSSVKVGVTLIIITLAASAIGTIFPQEMYIPTTEPASIYYESQYGFLGKLYYVLGLHNLYSSWWYLVLIASIGISLVICSLDRVIPLYRALKNQKVSRHEGFLKRQRLFGISKVDELDHSYELVKEKLESKRYKIREENGDILAEKGRFSRWGPYINHIGLIIFLIGGMMRFVPGMYVDELLWVREGETAVIPETNGEYYLENHKFVLEVYDKDSDNEAFANAIENNGMVAKNFQTDTTLYKKSAETVAGEEPILDKVEDYELRVNEPLKFEQFALYQQSYKLDELNQMHFALTNKETNEALGDLTIDLYNPQDEYDLGEGYKVEVLSYFPDFEFDENSEPVTKSRIPNNPAFVFKMFTPEKPDGEVSFVAIKQTIEPFGDNDFKMTFKGVETKNVSAITVRKDLTLGILAVGGFIFMIGVIQGAYWNHRRIWLRRVDGEVWVAGHTNKNWHGLKREITGILQGTGIEEPKDQLDEKEK